MRSATSYFNGPLYRKTLARFWPLWGLWAVGWLFLLPLNFLNSWLRYSRQPDLDVLRFMQTDTGNVPDLLESGVVLALCFAILCAMAVFGYLYNHRSACWFHALPLRREALFTTQYLAGLSMMLLPLLVTGVLTAIVEVSFLPMESWGVALAVLLTWLLAQCGLCLFFFSFAAFCAMFTGHILALPAFYGILNFLAAGLWFLVDALMNEFYYGYAGTPGALTVVEYLTPAYALERAVRWWPENGLNSPGTVAVYAAVGVALAFASLYVYRRRHVETAGDVVAVAIVRPLFKYGVSFCAGLAFGMFTAAFFGWSDLPALIPCILVWTAVGYFVAEMLLRKSFRVLNAWKGGAVMTAVMLALCLVCLVDVFDIVNRVPNAGQVASVQVHIEMGYPYDSGQVLDTELTDPAQIEKLLALHQAVVDNRDQDAGSDRDYTSIYLYYNLAGGGELNRRYHSVSVYEDDLDTPGTVAYALKQILDDRTLVAMAYDFDGLLDGAILTTARLRTVEQYSPYGGVGSTSVYIEGHLQELWEAVHADFEEGTIGLRYPFYLSQDMVKNTYETSLIFGATDEKVASRPGAEVASAANYELEIYLTPNARHTLAVLDQTGIWEEGYRLVSWGNYDTPHTVS